jgi:putative membrane protein
MLAHAWTVLHGILIGIANIIPGVSGGTFALVLGIYERLLGAIGALGLGTLRATWGLVSGPGRPERRRAFLEEWRRTDATWLAVLVLGAGAAILASSRLIAWLLEVELAPTLAFFVGLILPSILVPYRLLERRSWREALACLLGGALLVGLTFVRPEGAGAGLGLLGLFLSGAVAISAMILPGVSGSFMLMVLGEYENVLRAINSFDLVRLGVFALGCLVGLLAFVRLLNWLLRRYHAVTMAFLIGLILGSLWVLWPFKEVPPGAKISAGVNVWPAALDASVAWVLGGFVLGLAASLGVLALGRRKPAAH